MRSVTTSGSSTQAGPAMPSSHGAAPIRVLHVPGRTQYVQKLEDDGIQLVNLATVGELTIPGDVTLAWLLRHRPWDQLDVLHLHHLDFEPRRDLRAALADCRRADIGVVFTAHDLSPIFGDRATHHRRLRELAAWDVPFVCLTPAAEAEVHRRLPAVRTVMIPHGYVASPGTPTRPPERDPGPTRFLLHGSLRRNRDIELVLACWRFSRALADTTMHLLLRAPSRASLVEDSRTWQAIGEHAVDPRLQVDVRRFPSDRELNDAFAAADCVVLPYRWASHSGQLEHALDLGVLPVAARTGYLPDQIALHDGLAADPEWFEWPAGHPYEHGARLLEALERAHAAIQDGWRSPHAEAFTEHRRREHATVLAAHRTVYESTR
jgi:glycosyltransferase involved in cell wall biosynthesis